MPEELEERVAKVVDMISTLSIVSIHFDKNNYEEVYTKIPEDVAKLIADLSLALKKANDRVEEQGKLTDRTLDATETIMASHRELTVRVKKLEGALQCARYAIALKKYESAFAHIDQALSPQEE